MSGQSRLIISKNALEKGSESTLTKNLMNANEVVKKDDIKGGKKQKK